MAEGKPTPPPPRAISVPARNGIFPRIVTSSFPGEEFVKQPQHLVALQTPRQAAGKHSAVRRAAGLLLQVLVDPLLLLLHPLPRFPAVHQVALCSGLRLPFE